MNNITLNLNATMQRLTQLQKAKQFEQEQAQLIENVKNSRTRRIKREGHKSEKDYWTNTDPK
jgi:hypothetical protein